MFISEETIQPELFHEGDQAPVIVPRSEHCISRKNIDREALKVLYRLKDHGYLAYLVGGSVRDLLLGRRPKDFDIGTNATPSEIKKLFRYSRIIGKRFRLVHVYFRGRKVIEVSTFRRQTEYDDREAARAGISEDSIFGTPREDAFRRDLTINGLFYNIADFSLIDYVGGMADLQAGIIRAIGDPERRFLRDPVRMMRAVRHAARTGFTIDPKNIDAIKQHCHTIRLCSTARVRDEWLKDMRSGSSRPWAQTMIEVGLFQHIFPSYAESFSSEHGKRVKGLLLSLLEELDSLIKNGEDVPESLLVAVLLYPLIAIMPEWEALRPKKIRWPTFEVRALIKGLLAPYEFSRAVRDGASQILSTLWPITICAEKGSWPKRVVSKPVFNGSLWLFNAVRKESGQSPVTVRPRAATKKIAQKRKNRKRRYRKKSATNPA